jgi:hypothetical protein
MEFRSSLSSSISPPGVIIDYRPRISNTPEIIARIGKTTPRVAKAGTNAINPQRIRRTDRIMIPGDRAKLTVI